MWWDLHLLNRKMLVKNFPLPSDAEEFQDVLDEIEEDKQKWKERREQREIKEKQS